MLWERETTQLLHKASGITPPLNRQATSRFCEKQKSKALQVKAVSYHTTASTFPTVFVLAGSASL